MSKLNDLIQGIGVTAEMTRLFYENFIKVGFTRAEALSLANNAMVAQMQIAALNLKSGEALE